ncbi:MAG: SUMF1/EgtB/PvdO family nonheme iron enzyme [gamma proteobacterium endosymbiont of Lamellibrachia anaximandri]|nr:SUMF1/EgtB/PvdO family nonheme iron enzyme [gamma proteobacterium endosymbiont of Lamellibrachia anaximandri]
MSDTQPNIKLRQLAREFAEGRIDRESYRARRAGLLDALSPTDKIAPSSERKATATTDRSILPLVTAAGGLLMLAGAGLFLLFTGEDEPISTPPAMTAETQPPPPPPVTPEMEETLVTVLQAFVQSDDWREESRERLLQAWQSRGAQAKAKVRSSRWFHDLETDFQSRLEEERGLATSRNGERVKSLLDFGRRLGLQHGIKDKTLIVAPPPEKKPRPVSPPPPPVEKPAPKTTPEPVTQAPPKPVTAVAPKQKMASPIETSIKHPVVSEPVKQKSEEKPAASPPRKQSANAEIPVPPGCRPKYSSRHRLQCRDRLQLGENGPWLAVLPGGLFAMGSTEKTQEEPIHQVNIAYPFTISTHEVNYREYARFCRTTTGECPEQPWNRDDLPVVNVSWDNAKRYTTWLSKQTGKGYRLPTEAEWEYAARAGSLGPYPVAEADLGSYAHYARHGNEDSPQADKPQRTNPNTFGLFHMAGNVREWVLDNWHNNYIDSVGDGKPRFNHSSKRRVVRGGSYSDSASALRSSARAALPQIQTDRYTGFRAVRDIYLKPGRVDLESWGDWWLSQQDATHYTVQLFALNQLNKLEGLMEHHSDLTIKVVGANDKAFRYRILYGLFKTKTAAEKAFNSLPETLRKQVPRLVIKQIEEL